MAKTEIDIEALLHWAYAVQQVDKFAAQVRRNMEGPTLAACDMSSIGALGLRVQRSGPILTSLGAKVADDAITVHDAVLELDDMFFEVRPSGDVHIWLPNEIEAAGRERRDTPRGDVLVRLSTLSGRPEWSDIIPVSRVTTSVLLILHARTGSRPDCYEDERRPRGRPAAVGEFDAWGRKRRVRTGPSWESVIAARAEYHVWHCALTVLAAELAGCLDFHAPTPPVAPSAPWDVRRGASAKQPKTTKIRTLQPTDLAD